MTGLPRGGETVRIAMWSGPRNLSTAMMRSFENRPDCAVADEPFYAAYLRLTGLDHPMRDAILDHHEADWRKVAAFVSGDAPGGRPVFYQKHMTHHMVPEIGRDWMRTCRHAFLIRHPSRVLASYAAKRETVALADIGFAQQADLFDEAASILGAAPPVVDADALLAQPATVLACLCEAMGIAFDAAMLRWPAGPRETDGIWAAHWYDAVHRSTGFGAASDPKALDHPRLREIEAEALPFYERLASYAIG